MADDRTTTPTDAGATHRDAALLDLAHEWALIKSKGIRIDLELDTLEPFTIASAALRAAANAGFERCNDIIEAASGLPAHTRDGARAKLTLIVGSVGLAMSDLENVADSESRLAWSLVQDLAGLEGAA